MSIDIKTRAVIERLIEASIESAFKWSATEEESAKLESAISEARKLLEDDDWIRVEDALLVEPLREIIADYVKHTSSEYLQAPPWLNRVRKAMIEAAKGATE